MQESDQLKAGNPMDDWMEPQVEAVDLQKMDALITEMREKKEAHEEAKKKATDIYKEYAALEHKVIAALKAAGKKSYKVDGLGTFSIVHKQVVTTPKTLDEKRQLFDYIREKYGDDVLDTLRSVNHQSLNSFYNQEAEKAEDPSLFEIPGISAPTIKEEARFRKG